MVPSIEAGNLVTSGSSKQPGQVKEHGNTQSGLGPALCQSKEIGVSCKQCLHLNFESRSDLVYFSSNPSQVAGETFVVLVSYCCLRWQKSLSIKFKSRLTKTKLRWITRSS